MKLILGDCLDKLKELDDNSIDSIVTDPPYGLSAAPNSGKSSKGGFMGKQWDYDVPSQEIWEECMRVLKPGGHLLSFAGSRTYHRMAVRIEDAGFEIRDQILWVYGQGFPKSMNISKAIDKREGAEREVIGTKGLNSYKTKEQGQDYGNLRYDFDKVNELTAPATDEAKKWNGWGTALKPAHEPIVMARKPLSEKTVVDNVLEWGTGGINIDESRIGNEPIQVNVDYKDEKQSDMGWGTKKAITEIKEQGRFPANVIFDEEAGKILDEQSGTSKSTGGRIEKKTGWGEFGGSGQKEIIDGQPGFGDSGGASRFFYCPKTSKRDRNEGLDGFPVGPAPESARSKPADGRVNALGESRQNHHPTVKPTDLMLYLIRLVTPKGGTTLDPFMGSGSTGKAAVRGGFEFVGIEREEEYMEIAKARIQYEIDNPYNEETGIRVKVNTNINKFF